MCGLTNGRRKARQSELWTMNLFCFNLIPSLNFISFVFGYVNNINDNEFEMKENKIKTKENNEPQHTNMKPVT